MNDEDFDIEDLPDAPEIMPDMMSREQFLEYTSMGHDVKRDLMWAFQALGAKDLKPEDAPSCGAWFIYTTTFNNDLSKKAFITGPLTKLLPTKAQMEKDDRAEDGRKQFDLIDQLLLESEPDAPVLSGAENRARELAVSTPGA